MFNFGLEYNSPLMQFDFLKQQTSILFQFHIVCLQLQNHTIVFLIIA